MKFVTLQYGEYTQAYIDDRSPKLGKRRDQAKSLDGMIDNLTKNLDTERKTTFLFRGKPFPEGEDAVKAAISAAFRKAQYE